MTRISPVIIFLFCATVGFGQRNLVAIDSLLLNADYQQALTLLAASPASSSRDTVLLRNKKVEALIGLGKLNEAASVMASIQTTDTFLEMVTQTNRGRLFMHQGRNDLAITVLLSTIQGLEEINHATSPEAANAITLLGLVYKFSGKHALAEQQMQRALSIRLAQVDEHHDLIAATYNNLGLVYTNVDNDKALEYYEKASTIYRILHGNEHPKTAVALTNIGFIYSLMELYGDALNHFEDALKIWEAVYAGPHSGKAFILFNMGEVYRQLANTTAARGFYERALSIYRETYGDKHPDIAGVLNALGNTYRVEGRYDEALTHFQEALRANLVNFTDADLYTNPEPEQYYHGNVLLYSLMYKAQTLEERYFGKSLRFSELTLALSTLKLCDTLIDRLRQQSTSESDKLALGVIATEVYEDGVRMAHEAASGAWKKRPYRELAFYFAEKSKSAVLLEAISGSDARSFAGIPPALLENEKALMASIATASQKLARKPAVEEERRLRDSLFHLNREYESFVKMLEREYPAYYNLKFNVTSPAARDLQQTLDNKTALLSYFIDEKQRRLYTFIITKERFEIMDHALSGDFDRYISGLRNGLYYSAAATYIKSSTYLSRLLLPRKFPKSVQRLVILPAGRLSMIPFETLFTKRADEASESWKTFPYLLNDYSVRYEFSAGVLAQKNADDHHTTAAGSILLCAPVVFSDNHLPPLPGTESEVREISALFSSRNMRSDVFIRQDASEYAIKAKALKEYDVLHFATHGVVDEREPALSRIFLHARPGAEDGNLYTGEIYNLELNARLVTLSACETGLGKISRGEGVIGLSRALVYAGAQHIVVSFWSVGDESTATMMKTFYRKILEGQAGYHESLRLAKLSLMEDPRYAAPYYWAPFVLIGY